MSGFQYWSRDEVATLIRLRIQNASWAECAEALPGRSLPACKKKNNALCNSTPSSADRAAFLELYREKRDAMWRPIADWDVQWPWGGLGPNELWFWVNYPEQAAIYRRFKSTMWTEIALKLCTPLVVVERMFWDLPEADKKPSPNFGLKLAPIKDLQGNTAPGNA